jgi:hypothetical protein
MPEQLPTIIEIDRAEYERLLSIAAGDGPSKSIAEFCDAERTSKAMYFKMQSEGWGPDEIYIGDLVRITPRAHRAWREQRAAAAAQGIRRGLPHKAA